MCALASPPRGLEAPPHPHCQSDRQCRAAGAAAQVCQVCSQGTVCSGLAAAPAPGRAHCPAAPAVPGQGWHPSTPRLLYRSGDLWAPCVTSALPVQETLFIAADTGAQIQTVAPTGSGCSSLDPWTQFPWGCVILKPCQRLMDCIQIEGDKHYTTKL